MIRNIYFVITFLFAFSSVRIITNPIAFRKINSFSDNHNFQILLKSNEKKLYRKNFNKHTL